MSRKTQQEKLLLTREGKLLARILSAGIDAFLSVLRNESSFKLTVALEIVDIPNWDRYYQEPSFIRKTPESKRSDKSEITIEETIKPEPELYDWIIRVLTDRFDKMASAAQEGKIDWEDIVGAVHCLRNIGTNSKENFIDLFLKTRAGIISIASIIVYNKPINILYEEAKSGNDDSFYKLIMLDKAILTADWANLRVRRATLDGDWKFFDKLGSALNKKPHSKKRQIRLAAFLLMFWRMGFEELNYLERVEFLQSFGFKENEIPEQDTLRQLIHRLQISSLLDDLFQNY